MLAHPGTHGSLVTIAPLSVSLGQFIEKTNGFCFELLSAFLLFQTRKCFEAKDKMNMYLFWDVGLFDG